jgi:hypothetical protein
MFYVDKCRFYYWYRKWYTFLPIDFIIYMFFSYLKNVKIGVIIQNDKDNNIWLQYFTEFYFIIFLEGVKETSDVNSSLIK